MGREGKPQGRGARPVAPRLRWTGRALSDAGVGSAASVEPGHGVFGAASNFSPAR